MSRRREGWWGVIFVVLVFTAGGMVSVPTGDDPGAKILSFYAANATVVVVAQGVGAVALVPLALFALALARRAPDRSSARRIVAALVLAVVAELATNIPPLVLALASAASASTAHTWAFAGDLTDAVLFASLGLFSLAVLPGREAWVRWSGAGVAVLGFVRAVASPLGFTGLDAVTPLAILAFVVALSVSMLREPVGGH